MNFLSSSLFKAWKSFDSNDVLDYLKLLNDDFEALLYVFDPISFGFLCWYPHLPPGYSTGYDSRWLKGLNPDAIDDFDFPEPDVRTAGYISLCANITTSSSMNSWPVLKNPLMALVYYFCS